MNAERVFMQGCGQGETVNAEGQNAPSLAGGGAELSQVSTGSAADAYSSNHRLGGHAIPHISTESSSCLPAMLVDIKGKLKLDTKYADLLFEASLPDTYDIKIKPTEKEIVIFNQKVMQ